jgi:diacylglycerol kinase (ATP)
MLNSQTSDRRAVVIYNPLSGRGRSAHFAQQSRQYLEQYQWQVESVVPTEYAGHIETELASYWGEKVDLIVLVGGDGTLRELAAGLRSAKQSTDIAFIPMGNANVVARELNIPLRAKAAIGLISKGRAKLIDVGIIRRRDQSDIVFLAMFEIGFGAKVAAIVDQLRGGPLKKLYQFWGDIVYGIAALLALKGIGQDKFDITLDSVAANEAPIKASSAHTVVANMQTYAKGWSLAPDARCDDGLLDVAISKRSTVWILVRTFLAASRKKKLKPALMTYQQSKNVSVSGSGSLYVQVDGDPITFSGNAEVHIEKRAFSILVL